MSVLTRPGTKRTASPEPAVAIPPLENGDRLTRAEFLRRYEAMPDLKKAELIEGVVYVGSPVRQKSHGRPHSYLIGWLFVYKAGTPGVETGDNSTVLLDLDNPPSPTVSSSSSQDTAAGPRSVMMTISTAAPTGRRSCREQRQL